MTAKRRKTGGAQSATRRRLLAELSNLVQRGPGAPRSNDSTGPPSEGRSWSPPGQLDRTGASIALMFAAVREGIAEPIVIKIVANRLRATGIRR